MNAAILTFQFAHNYGALLQAYALSRYLKGRNIHVEIAPYNPEWAQAEYAISPLAKGIPPRRRIRLALQYPRRKKQSQFFEQFIAEELNAGSTFATEPELYQWLDRHDCVVCGSDQIWNNRITGDGAAYYAAGSRVKKVSYAASLVADEHYGVTVAMVNRHVTANPLADIAGKTRGVPGDCDMVNVARAMGISLG